MPSYKISTIISSSFLFVQTLSFFLGIMLPATARNTADLELKIGVVQKFGEKLTDELTISSTPGNVLTLEFLGGNLQPQTLSTDSVKLEMAQSNLKEPFLQEYLVLSDHATFETAEESARQWKMLGIEVEVTQPERWQVWAKRSVYSSPLVRRLLLESLRSQGYEAPNLETKVVKQSPVVSFVVDGYRYNRRELKITAGNNRIKVIRGKNSRNSRLYGGKLKIQPNAYYNYTLVNDVPLETYLRGVVPHEIGIGAPYNAIKAQAILARTYALRNLRRFAADNYELCATTHCQVYFGLNGAAENTDRAIAATKGQVLTYNNELVDALYSASTGGVTAPFTDVWNGIERPYLLSVIDAPTSVWNLSQQSLADEQNFRRFIDLKEGFNETASNAGKSVFRWNRSSSLEQLNQDLRKYLTKTKHPLADFTTIISMEVTERSPAGRVLVLTVQTDKGEVILEKNEARSAFGPPRSTLFYVEPLYEEVKEEQKSGQEKKPNDLLVQTPQLKGFAFVGGGFGHGVGMSQYGSYNLAKLGWSTDRILQFYYPGTQIKPLDGENPVVIPDRD